MRCLVFKELNKDSENNLFGLENMRFEGKSENNSI